VKRYLCPTRAKWYSAGITTNGIREGHGYIIGDDLVGIDQHRARHPGSDDYSDGEAMLKRLHVVGTDEA
jgi:hypothetical protein